MIKHLAIIMDGNGRWATNSSKARREGHKMGAKKVQEITQFCLKKGIPFLTLYAFSTENWNRPKIEIDFLMRLLEKYLQNEEKSYVENEIKFDFIGDVTIFSSRLQDKLFALKEKTKQYTKLTQSLALNYGAHDEISRTFLKILQSDLDLENINKAKIKNLIENNLDTKDYPPVDILVRTGGECRLSNFLLWQISYAELFFSKTLWPDFSSEELEHILKDFKKRTRKFGTLQ